MKWKDLLAFAEKEKISPESEIEIWVQRGNATETEHYLEPLRYWDETNVFGPRFAIKMTIYPDDY
jgi:hypothetical protein